MTHFLPPCFLAGLLPVGECERGGHLPGPPHRHVRLPGAGDPTARAPEDRRSKGRGFSVYRWRDGRRHVCGEDVANRMLLWLTYTWAGCIQDHNIGIRTGLFLALVLKGF